MEDNNLSVEDLEGGDALMIDMTKAHGYIEAIFHMTLAMNMRITCAP